MCNECHDFNAQYESDEAWDQWRKVDLKRWYPKDKNITPVEWLEQSEENRGHFTLKGKDHHMGLDLIFTAYGGQYQRMYSQPMFTLKSAVDECVPCDHGSSCTDDNNRFYGCICGNVAYTRDCPEHPTPSVNSRWIKYQQAYQQCVYCHKELDQENTEDYSYCNDMCRMAKAKQRQQRRWVEVRSIDHELHS